MTAQVDPQVQASARVDADPAQPQPAWPRTAAERLALAWALKDLCYAAWGSDPPRAGRASAVLQQLSESAGRVDGLGAADVIPRSNAGFADPAERAELSGLAHWTAGIVDLNHGRMADAVQAFDAAAAALRSAGRADPAAQTQVPKIMALSMLGRHDEATTCAVAAQRELLALGNVRAAARVSLNLGNLLGRRDDYAAASGHYRQAAVLFARLGEHEQSVLADIGLAWCFTSLGDFDEALRVCARAEMRAGHRGLLRQLALVDENVALVQLARGRYPQALARFESARRRYETLAVPQNLAIAEKQLADAYLELHLLPEALALFDTALHKFQQLQLPDEQAWTLAQRGRALALSNRPQPAGQAFAQAATLFAAQGNAVGASRVALARAELALAGHDADTALAWLDEAAPALGSAAQADGQARAAVLRAEALLQRGEARAAQAAFDAALATARERQQLPVQVRCLTGQGLAAQALGEHEAARFAFESAIELFEDQRRALPGDELRSAFLTDHLRPYQELLRLALAAGDATQVLQALDRYRARALSDRWDDEPLAVDGARAAITADDEEQQALRERLNWLYRRVQRVQDGLEQAADADALRAELLSTESRLLERARRQRLAAGDSAVATGQAGTASPSAAGFFSVPELQAALQTGDAVLAYGALDDELFACVVTTDGVHLQRQLAAMPQVVEALDSARFQIDSLRNGAQAVQQHLPVLTRRAQLRLQRLHTLVWAPLAPALVHCRRVIVVPHGLLGLLPFAALAPDAEALPLGEALQLALAPSVRAALRGLQRPPTPARTVLVLGESSRLPHAAREAQAVAALFTQGQSFVGEAATGAVLRQHAGQADVLHLACHAQFRSDNPRFSALHLADGAFTVDDAETLGLMPCTVVLSACETALAQLDGGDERVGLVRAFLLAGASRVLASLWPVDDAVTAGFMAAFYGALLEGQGPAAALGHAQAQTRKTHAHPCFWGAFTLHGAW